MIFPLTYNPGVGNENAIFINTLFTYLKSKISELTVKQTKQEQEQGSSKEQYVLNSINAIIAYFLHIKYQIQNPYTTVLTLEEYKELYITDEMIDCLACDNISLNGLWDVANFEQYINPEIETILTNQCTCN